MSKFRTLVFLYLITFPGLLWSVFLAWIAGYFLEGAMMAGLIIVTNLISMVMYFRKLTVWIFYNLRSGEKRLFIKKKAGSPSDEAFADVHFISPVHGGTGGIRFPARGYGPVLRGDDDRRSDPAYKHFRRRFAAA